MQLFSWLHKRATGRPHTERTPARKPTPRFRPQLESLEGRDVPSTLTVMNNLDSGDGSLRADIKAAKNGDTIDFAPSLDGQTITLTSGELVIDKDLTIQGPGATQLTVSGDNLSRVFYVKARQTVTLSDMTISNGNGLDGGQGMPTQSEGFGGGIINYGELTLMDCTVSNNSATMGGGGIDSGLSSGNGTNVQGTLTVSGCQITGNFVTGSGGLGGGIYISGGTATVSNNFLSGNSAGSEGGAIYNFSGTVAVSGCQITGNSAGFRGGAIYNSGGALTVSTSFFSTNTPDNIFGSFTDGGGNTFV